MKGIPTACIKYYAEQQNISVLDVFKQLYDNKTIKFDLTNDGNKCVETIKIIQYLMYHISLENANISEMQVISSLLIKLSFIFLIIYSGRSYKRSLSI